FGAVEGRGGGQAAFSPDGKTLASVGDDGKAVVRLWDPQARRLRAVLRGHKGPFIGPIAFSPCGRLLATVGTSTLDRRVLVWDVAAGKPLHGWPGHEVCRHLAFTPDGRLLVAANDTTVLPG